MEKIVDITKEKAVAFLMANQPLPSGSDLTFELRVKYNQVREYFVNNPDPVCIPLFLNSFGSILDFGTYQLVDEVLWQFNREEVNPHILRGLQSDSVAIQFWNAEFAEIYPDIIFRLPLRQMLYHKNIDCRFASVSALSMIRNDDVDHDVLSLYNRESDEDLKNHILMYFPDLLK